MGIIQRILGTLGSFEGFASIGSLGGKTPITRINRRVLLCGKTYSIKLIPGTKNSCKITETHLIFTLKEMTRENFSDYYFGWYRRQSRKIFKESMLRWREIMERKGYYLPPHITLKIYKMRRAWGRCYYTKDVITLNEQLAATPPQCINYILLHELCHFLFHNHSADFYAAVERMDPHWRLHERLLTDFARQNRLIR